ncbi:hypothetical protein D3C85_1538920 [compost metagenome]
MPHDNRQRTSVDRDLIERVDMVPVVALTIGNHRFVGIKLAWLGDSPAAGDQAALILDNQRTAVIGTDKRAGA